MARARYKTQVMTRLLGVCVYARDAGSSGPANLTSSNIQLDTQLHTSLPTFTVLARTLELEVVSKPKGPQRQASILFALLLKVTCKSV